jgi:hypothetical protein
MKTRQPSNNANKIVEWLEAMNFQLHNMPGVATHYPHGQNNAKPSVVDFCFSRGHITAHVDSWTTNDEPTSDHSII